MSAHDLARESAAGTLGEKLAWRFRAVHGYETSESEQRSWRNSLPVLADTLVDVGLGDVELLVEYPVPLSSYRVDALLCGVNPATGEPSYVAVELKQWSEARPIADTEDLVVLDNVRDNRARLHPIAQVRRYCVHIADFTEALHGHEHRISGAAYLHNATDDDVQQLFAFPVDAYGRLFTGSGRREFQKYLAERLAPLAGAEAADALRPEAVSPSKRLMAVAAEEIARRSHFNLLDEQRIAYSLVMRALTKARRAESKEVIVVIGGPGSGKSVIALELLGELYRNGLSALHATGSKSFTTTLQEVAGGDDPRVRYLFRYFNDFTKAPENGVDVLICDEAHRIREPIRRPARHIRGYRRQVETLLEAARVPVFLLDEEQVVRPGERCDVAVIDEAAAAMNLPVRHVSLDAQFRCGGSRAYEEWVLRLLELRPGGPMRWGGDDRFTVQVAETPQELEAVLRSRQEGGEQARMTAGFCWGWSDPKMDAGRRFTGLVDDVDLNEWDWARPWNVKGDRPVGGYPSKNLWATDPAGFSQVGCIYTAQGFEYDWNGVILGPDLVWRDGTWVPNREASKDSAVAGCSPVEFAYLIRNTYKVLLTRGMRGTVLFSTDRETREMLRTLVLGR
ncbi:DNA/RNA helicase domain-containing protein [Streptomyces massasporeus]